MSHFSPDNIDSLAVSAIRAANYLDACDAGAHGVRLNPDYYQACGNVLQQIFSLLDPDSTFPVLLELSPAARDIADSVKISQKIGVSRLVYYPELSVVLNRASV